MISLNVGNFQPNDWLSFATASPVRESDETSPAVVSLRVAILAMRGQAWLSQLTTQAVSCNQAQAASEVSQSSEKKSWSTKNDNIFMIKQ